MTRRLHAQSSSIPPLLLLTAGCANQCCRKYYKSVGGDMSLKRMYGLYQAFTSLIKLDLQFCGIHPTIHRFAQFVVRVLSGFCDVCSASAVHRLLLQF